MEFIKLLLLLLMNLQHNQLNNHFLILNLFNIIEDKINICFIYRY